MSGGVIKREWRWRRQTWALLVCSIVAVLIALVASYAFASFRPTTELKLGQSGVFHVWVADTDELLYKGLSGVEKLPANGGLLMDFKVSGKHGIVMRDMLVPLDIVWLDEQRVVTNIRKNVPASYDEELVPLKNARYVIELPAGTVDQSRVKIGNIAYFAAGDK